MSLDTFRSMAWASRGATISPSNGRMRWRKSVGEQVGLVEQAADATAHLDHLPGGSRQPGTGHPEAVPLGRPVRVLVDTAGAMYTGTSGTDYTVNDV